MKTNFLLNALTVIFVFTFINNVNAQWSQVALRTESINCLTANKDTTVLFAGTASSGIYSTSDQGSSWQRRDSGVISSSCNAINTQSNNYIAGTSNGVYVSQDNGNTWFTSSSITGITDPQINTICLDVNGDVFVGTNSSIFYMPNGGKGAFSPRNSGLPAGATINALFDYPNQSEQLWCGTNAGLFLSNDHGANWSKVSGITSHVNSILCQGIILVCTTVGLFESNNNGKNFGGPFNSTMDVDYLSQCIVPTPNPSIWMQLIGTGFAGKVYSTTNWGNQCSDKSNGLTVTRINCLAVMGPYLIAGTDNGIWKRALEELTPVENQTNLIPEHYFLSQNYPNPFNPATVINYQIPRYGLVTLKVYDILGREIKTLVNGFKPQGNYSVNFNAGSLSSGVYFYKLNFGGYSSIKKMILLK
jgi:photosystem II stability/assembly factor-like uncharacterized protein